MALLVLSVVGSDKPGLTKALAAAVLSAGGNWLQRREYRTVAADLATLDAVTLDDVHAVLANYRLTRASTATVGPLLEFKP